MRTTKKTDARWIIRFFCGLILGVIFAAVPTFADDYTVDLKGFYSQSDAREMLRMINEFRTGSDAWYWDDNNTQKIYLTEFMKKTIALSKSDISTPVKLYNAAEDYSCTNFTINGVTYLATELMRNGSVTTKTATIPVDVKEANNRAENYIREDEFYELFLSVFYNEVS